MAAKGAAEQALSSKELENESLHKDKTQLQQDLENERTRVSISMLSANCMKLREARGEIEQQASRISHLDSALAENMAELQRRRQEQSQLHESV